MTEGLLHKEIEAVDNLLSSLGSEGASFVEALHDLNSNVKELPEGQPYAALYVPEDNTYYFPRGTTLAKIFNSRVHEGAHAIQTNLSPVANAGIINLDKYNEEPIISLADMIRYERLAEINAYSMQTYFNFIATLTTENNSFISCFQENGGLGRYRKLQSDMLSKGLSPEEAKDAMALKILSLRNSTFPIGGVRLKNVYDARVIEFYTKCFRDYDLEGRDKIELPFEELKKSLNAVSPLGNNASDKILKKSQEPVEVSLLNKAVIRNVGLEL